jgi:glycine hydroxymethyltransferase
MELVSQQIEAVLRTDPEIAALISAELNRQRGNIELIASENIVSEAVLAAAGSVLTNKYAEGYPRKRFYGGCEYVDVVESIAIERAKTLFSAKFANVQPHSGAQANLAAYLALCKPGDTVLGMNLDHGGHLTHGSAANFSGKQYNIVAYGVDPQTGLIDYDEVERLAMEHRPRMIIAGASAYPRIIDFARFGDIAKKSGAYFMADIAHIAGLVAADLHPSPLLYADVVTSTTHKTLRGPRGGLLLTNNEDIAKKLNSAVFPGCQGGPLMHIIAAKAVALGEACRPEFKAYEQRIIKNAAALASGLTGRGHTLISGGTDNHLMLMDLRGRGLSGRELEVRLDSVHITTNKNKIPGDPAKAAETSGLRLGTPTVTTRGFDERDMDTVAELISLAITSFDAEKDYIAARVQELCEKYPIY